MIESLMSLEEILKSTNGKLVYSPSEKIEFCFDNVTTDSRQVKENSLFVPLVGERQDGHIYIHQAIQNGATVIFAAISWVKNNWEEIAAKLAYEESKSFWVIGVENTLYALQDAAANYVQKFPNLKRIGITGSSGKTTTKEIAVSVFSQFFDVIYNEGNFNSETGLPLSVFKIRKNHQVGIFEMGMNRFGEMAELAKVLKPQYVIITNIGTAHIGILGNRDNIAKEKKSSLNYFTDKSVVCVNKNDDYADFLTKDIPGKAKFYSDSMETISNIVDLGLEGTSFYINDEYVKFNLYGKYNFHNALSVISMAQEFGIPDEKIALGLKNVKILFGRAQIIRNFANIMGCTLVLDCYNANPDSMSASLNFCGGVDVSGTKYFVLGDMKELGKDSVSDHKKIMELILAFVKNAQKIKVFLFGSEMSAVANLLEEKVSYEVFSENSDSQIDYVVDYLLNNLKSGDLVLVKGSRGMALERVTNKILQKKEAKNE